MEKKSIDFAAIPQTALKVLTSPVSFFREMAKTGGFVEPLVFLVALAIVTAIVDGVLGILGLKFILSVWAALFSIIITPVVAVIGGFIVAAILFIIWKLLGSQESYETAYRCVAYLAALWPIMAMAGAIPYIGALISIGLLTYFLVTASVETHKISSQKAWVVFGIIGAALFFISLGAQIATQGTREQLLEMQRQMQNK
jgi:hypothetical protein